MTRQARREGGALAGLPTRPTSHADQLDRWSLTILDAGEWVNVDQVLTALRARIATTAAASVPTVGVAVEELTAALKALNRTADAVNLRRIDIPPARELKDADLAALAGRIASQLGNTSGRE